MLRQCLFRALVVTTLAVALVPYAPVTTADHVPAMVWEWCVEDRCVLDEGIITIERETTDTTGHYSVDFVGALGSAHCDLTWVSGEGGQVTGAITFPVPEAGVFVGMTYPCQEVYANVTMLQESPLFGPMCTYWGAVGADSRLGALWGETRYNGSC